MRDNNEEKEEIKKEYGETSRKILEIIKQEKGKKNESKSNPKKSRENVDDDYER